MTDVTESASIVKPSVAICIGTYNQAQYLRGSIESALAQTYPIQELWVVDDCSTDDTPAVMEQLCAEYPQIRYHRHPQNVGPAINLSWALSQPTTDLIARLDSDDLMEPTYVEVLAELLSLNPEAGFAHCNVQQIDGQGHKSRLRQIKRTNVYENPESALRNNSSAFRVAANCLLFRAAAIKEMDYYRLHPTWTFGEDWDLALRMAIAGWGNVFSSQVLTNYRWWDDPQGTRARRKMMEVTANLSIYKDRLIPEYQRRGWDTALLFRFMQRKAIGFVDALDSPRFSEQDRADYKAMLLSFGKSRKLSFAVWAAESGFNPLVRSFKNLRLKVKDWVKRLIAPPAPNEERSSHPLR